MATKTLTIMEDVYEKLVALKKKDESFSEELRRLTQKKDSILDLAGSWNSETAEKIHQDIKQSRKEWKQRI